MNTIKHYLIMAGFICLLAAAGCAAQAGSSAPAATQVEDSELTSMVSATGVVVPARWSRLSMPASGLAGEVLVQAGQRVEAGTVLVRLSCGDPAQPSADLQAALRAAEVEVAGARAASDQLGPQARTALIQAQQAMAATALQVRDLQYQIEQLDVPGEQAAQTPLDAYGQVKTEYTRAWKAFIPFKDEPAGNETRQERQQDLNAAREAYEIAVLRLQLDQSLDAALASQEQARHDLLAYGAGPRPDDVALAQSRLALAEAHLAAALQAIDSCSLRAPFAGTVTEVLIRPGEFVTPGVPVLVLADLDHLVIETTDLNEIDMARLQPGSQAAITFDALPDLNLAGQVVFIAPAASSGSGVNYKATLQLESQPDRLRWGMSAFVDMVPVQSGSGQ